MQVKIKLQTRDFNLYLTYKEQNLTFRNTAGFPEGSAFRAAVVFCSSLSWGMANIFANFFENKKYVPITQLEYGLSFILQFFPVGPTSEY